MITPSVVIGYNTTNATAAWGFSNSVPLGPFVQFQETGSGATSNMLAGKPAPTMSDGGTYVNTSSDPSVVETGWPGVAAYFTTASSTKNAPAQDVVLFTSTDGGRNWGADVKVISSGDSGGGGGAANPGQVDQPWATYEGSLGFQNGMTHVLWLNWTNSDTAANLGGKRNWIKKVSIDKFGQINTSSPEHQIRVDCNLNCTKYANGTLAAYCTNNALGCVGGTEVILNLFPRVNNGSSLCDNLLVTGMDDTDIICNQKFLGCPATLDVEFRAMTSTDGGVTWTQGVGGPSGSIKFAEDPAWPTCIVAGDIAPIGNNRARMPVVHDDITGAWHILLPANSAKGWVGPERSKLGAPSGQRIFHTESVNDTLTGLTSNLAEVCPVFNRPKVAGSPCDPRSDGTAECFFRQWSPQLAVSHAANNTPQIMAVWHDSRLTTDVAPTMSSPALIDGTPSAPTLNPLVGAFSSSSGSGLVGTWLSGSACTQVSQARSPSDTVPWSDAAETAPNTPWGDYEGMGASHDSSQTFFAAWADDRLQVTSPSVAIAVLSGPFP